MVEYTKINNKSVPYKYYIDLRTLPEWFSQEFEQWVSRPEFTGKKAGFGLYLRTDEDLSIFLLRWS